MSYDDGNQVENDVSSYFDLVLSSRILITCPDKLLDDGRHMKDVNLSRKHSAAEADNLESTSRLQLLQLA